ncbi:ABC transporter permease [Eubacterium barkeri]|uniref:Transport permease protein n=1 Tax=Eubacterium barkeri TaxID=1528 RepID=A0A1H3CFZ6_EUBBA|nr:ABC transporter permease [Eubacterium barkeri]SDX52950.1 teichoic acid transport system permease protein [Eubacterium barkeri]
MIKDFLSFFRDLYKNRKLLIQFSVNDFKAKYAGSFFGVFWAFFTPMVTIAVYWFVFEKGMKAGMTDGSIPFIIYLVTGIIVWFFFSDTILSATNCFRDYSYLVKKVVFNFKVLPTAKLLSNLYTHIFFIGIAFLLTSLYGFYPSLYSLQILYYLFCLIAILTGITWITASIQPFFSDITNLIGIILQVLMWGTPILWSINQFPSEYHLLFKLNPLMYIVQGYRESFLSQGWFWQHGEMTVYFWIVTLVMLLLGSLIYNKMNPHFSDVL